MKLITSPYFPHSTKGLVMYVTALQVGGHVPMVTSHLWLSEWQHPSWMLLQYMPE